MAKLGKGMLSAVEQAFVGRDKKRGSLNACVGGYHIHGQKENRLKLFRFRRQSPEKLNNPKPLFSRIEELYFSKEVKENALALEGKSRRP